MILNRTRSCLPAVLLLACAALPGACRKEPAAGTNSDPQAGRPSITQSPPPRPNIVFIMIDTLRADMLGAHGRQTGSTPTLDQVAAEGVLFERAIAAAPWTQPSMASLFSGVYPGVHRVLDYRQALESTFKGEPKVIVFADRFETLAECLQQAGYATAGFVANPYCLEAYGFAQGFEHYDTSFAKNTTTGRIVNEAAVAWLKQRPDDRPFFLYLHYMDVHGPYNAAPQFLEPLLTRLETSGPGNPLTDPQLKRLGYLRRLPKEYTDRQRHAQLARSRDYWVARYEAGVRQMDHHLAELRSSLQGLDVWNEAYVMVTADHGEALCEHGWWEHGWSAHHTDLHVPLILRWPDRLRAGERVTATVRLIDVLPTVTAQLGLAEPDVVQGRSLIPYLNRRPPGAPTIAFAEGVKLGAEQKAVHLGDWKLLAVFGDDGSIARRKLYNLRADPYEQSNLLEAQPDQARSLTALLTDQIRENEKRAAGAEVQAVPLTPEQIERLRALGYLQ